MDSPYENIKLALQAKKSAHEARKHNRHNLQNAIVAFLKDKSDVIVSNINHNPSCWNEIWIATDIVTGEFRAFTHDELAAVSDDIKTHTGLVVEVNTGYNLVQLVFRF